MRVLVRDESPGEMFGPHVLRFSHKVCCCICKSVFMRASDRAAHVVGGVLTDVIFCSICDRYASAAWLETYVLALTGFAPPPEVRPARSLDRPYIYGPNAAEYVHVLFCKYGCHAEVRTLSNNADQPPLPCSCGSYVRWDCRYVIPDFYCHFMCGGTAVAEVTDAYPVEQHTLRT